MSITESKLKLIINKNDFEKLEYILNNNPDYFVTDKLIYYTISKKHVKCFDILLNHPNINYIDYSYDIAFKIYNNAKNEDNKYFISKLLDKNYYIEERTLPYMIDYDINLFNKHLDMNITDNRFIQSLMIYLSFNKYYLYFVDLFNNRWQTLSKSYKILSKEQQIRLVKHFYTHPYLYENDKVFSYLMDSQDFNYKAITTNEEYIIDNMFNFLYDKNSKIKIKYMNFLLKNPIDFNCIINNEDMIIKFLRNTFYNQSDFSYKKYSLDINYKNKCIINSPKINIIKMYCNHFNYKYMDIKLLYDFYNLGLKIDVYGDLTNEDITNYFNNYNLHDLYDNTVHIINFIQYVQFGNLIGQHMPLHLVDTIKNLCNNSKFLNKKYKI